MLNFLSIDRTAAIQDFSQLDLTGLPDDFIQLIGMYQQSLYYQVEPMKVALVQKIS